jgi:hypothetical protein
MGGFVSVENQNVTANRLVEQLGGQGWSEPSSGDYFAGLRARSPQSGPVDQGADDRLPSTDPSSSANRDAGAAETSASSGASGQAGSQGNARLASPYQHLSLANQRGENWALPSKTPGATGYVRPIRVICGANELQVQSVLGTEATIAVNGDWETSVDRLVNAIWKQIESWGVAGGGSYWKPELRISVLSGGELNFEKLQGLLDSSGISLKQADQ